MYNYFRLDFLYSVGKSDSHDNGWLEWILYGEKREREKKIDASLNNEEG